MTTNLFQGIFQQTKVTKSREEKELDFMPKFNEKENANSIPNVIKTPQKQVPSKFISPDSRSKTPQLKGLSPIISSNNSDIKVFLRIRPLLGQEEHANFQTNGKIVTARPSQKQVPSGHIAERTFQFTHIFDEKTSQSEVFESVALPMLSRFMKGQDTLLLAYGATSAGKTFTIQGTDTEPGLLPRMISTLLHIKPQSGTEMEIDISCVEVYNERVHDLFGDNTKPLRIGKDGFGFTTVKEVTEIQLHNNDDMKRILKDIDSARRRSSTTYNSESSRSHCVFMIKMITIPLTSQGTRCTDLRKIKCTRMTIVDLAGSERVTSSNQDKKIIGEASSINKSMFILGCCIRKLRKVAAGDNTQIPFRESKLTELLRDFFDSKDRQVTVGIIINISPSTAQFEDTLFALQFAAEAIHCGTKANIDFTEEEKQVTESEFGENQNQIVEMQHQYQALENIRSEMNEQIAKIQKVYHNQLEQIKAQSAQPYTSKLQKVLAQRMANENKNKELMECKKELQREKDHANDLERQIEEIKLQIEESSKKLQEVQSQNGSLQKNLEKMIDMTKRLHEKEVNAQKEIEGKIRAIEEFYTQRIKKLEAEIESFT